MELVEFGADDGPGVDAYVTLSRACDALDCPWEVPITRARQLREMRFGWDGEIARYFLVRTGGEDVGIVCLYAPEHDNVELVWADLRISPEQRRRGLGRAAFAELARTALGMGRPLVVLERGWDTPATHGFAAALGFPLGLVTVRRVLDLAGTPAERTRFAELRAAAEAHAGGYDLVRVTGRTPPELLDGLVTATAAINDAPNGDLEYEDEVYDADRIRSFEKAQLDGGFRLRRVLAVERTTGAVAGHTVVSVYGEQPSYAEQDDTTVVAEHRGHRLGLRLKADMLCWLAEEEPQLRTLLTDNAESNEHMIAVNEALGFRVAGRQLLFQRRVDAQDALATLG